MGHSLVDITFEPGADQILLTVDEATREWDLYERNRTTCAAAWALGHMTRIRLDLDTGAITVTIVDHGGPRHGEFISGLPMLESLKGDRIRAEKRLALVDRIFEARLTGAAHI